MAGKQLVRVWNVPLKSGPTIKVATIEQGPRKPSMCDGCSAPCCRGSFRPILTSEEFLSRKFKFTYTPPEPWFKKQVPNAQFLATLDIGEDGCPYFDKDRAKCSIWSDCPAACKAYDCREDTRKEIRAFVKKRMKEWRNRNATILEM